jgi:quercetin dioxygenase-like cupin family protein
MHVNVKKLQGIVVKDTEVYTLEDNNLLENLTLSKTHLKPGQETRGHSHDEQEEVYFFIKGLAEMVLGEERFNVEPGSIVLIPKGKFHKVINRNDIFPCVFVCVFEKYDRSGQEAKY